MGKSSCCGDSHGSCYCYWLDSCGSSTVGRSYAIVRFTSHEASARVACVTIAVVGVHDARTVTESFVDVVEYFSAKIHLVIKTILRQNVSQQCFRIRALLELNYAPFAPAVARIGDRLRSLHLV